jgi:hypothetical protein
MEEKRSRAILVGIFPQGEEENCLKSIEELPSASEELVNMFEKTREKEEDERAAEQEQMTIDELEIGNSADNPEQNEVSKEATEQNNAVEEVVLNEDSDDEPSAEDDIIDVD